MDPLRPMSLPVSMPSARPAARAEVAPQEEGDRFEVRPGRPAEDLELVGELVHPGTAWEFRPVLDETLGLLPPRLVRAVAAQGYRLHVVDSTEQHPCTLELEPGDQLWLGEGISAAAWDLVTQPRRCNVAGMVYHGKVAGLRGEGLRIVLWDTVFRRGDGLADWYVLHELGHCTDYSFAFGAPDRWRKWAARVEAAYAARSTFLTSYAGESSHEYFAEGFAAWATPPGWERTGVAAPGLEAERWAVDHDVLCGSDPVLYGLVEEVVVALTMP